MNDLLVTGIDVVLGVTLIFATSFSTLRDRLMKSVGCVLVMLAGYHVAEVLM